MAAACYKCAGACTMRAFRLQHKESSKDSAVALKRARDDEAAEVPLPLTLTLALALV